MFKIDFYRQRLEKKCYQPCVRAEYSPQPSCNPYDPPICKQAMYIPDSRCPGGTHRKDYLKDLHLSSVATQTSCEAIGRFRKVNLGPEANKYLTHYSHPGVCPEKVWTKENQMAALKRPNVTRFGPRYPDYMQSIDKHPTPFPAAAKGPSKEYSDSPEKSLGGSKTSVNAKSSSVHGSQTSVSAHSSVKASSTTSVHTGSSIKTSSHAPQSSVSGHTSSSVKASSNASVVNVNSSTSASVKSSGTPSSVGSQSTSKSHVVQQVQLEISTSSGTFLLAPPQELRDGSSFTIQVAPSNASQVVSKVISAVSGQQQCQSQGQVIAIPQQPQPRLQTSNYRPIFGYGYGAGPMLMVAANEKCIPIAQPQYCHPGQQQMQRNMMGAINSSASSTGAGARKLSMKVVSTTQISASATTATSVHSSIGSSVHASSNASVSSSSQGAGSHLSGMGVKLSSSQKIMGGSSSAVVEKIGSRNPSSVYNVRLTGLGTDSSSGGTSKSGGGVQVHLSHSAQARAHGGSHATLSQMAKQKGIKARPTSSKTVVKTTTSIQVISRGTGSSKSILVNSSSSGSLKSTKSAKSVHWASNVKSSSVQTSPRLMRSPRPQNKKSTESVSSSQDDEPKKCRQPGYVGRGYHPPGVCGYKGKPKVGVHGARWAECDESLGVTPTGAGVTAMGCVRSGRQCVPERICEGKNKIVIKRNWPPVPRCWVGCPSLGSIQSNRAHCEPKTGTIEVSKTGKAGEKDGKLKGGSSIIKSERTTFYYRQWEREMKRREMKHGRAYVPREIPQVLQKPKRNPQCLFPKTSKSSLKNSPPSPQSPK